MILNKIPSKVKIHNFDWESNLEKDRKELKNLKRGSRVLCILPRSGEWVSCLIACWLEGMVFIPVDPSNTSERINLITKISEPHIVKNIYGWEHWDDGKISPELAWICFTSGSTGKPKAVMVPFDGLENMIYEQIKMFEINEKSNVLWSMSPGFDASFSDVCVSIFSGATLYPIDDKSLKNSDLLFDFINSNKITYADLTPTLSNILSKKDTTLKSVVFGGEVANPDSIRKLTEKMKVINVYGPTEATVCTSMIQCQTDWSLPSIGHPIKGVQYMEQNEELLISGSCLALGYMKNSEETKNKFITIDDTIWYKTGDRVSWDEKTGTYIFKGRIDREFKKSGVRISPEEIEWSLKQAEGVLDVKVILNGKSIIAFIEGDDTYAKEKSSLLYQTAKPNQWITLKKWNRLPSGKADIKWLMSHIKENTDKGELLDIVYDITGYKPNWNDSFYSCGGDSLTLMNLICACEEAGIEIDINSISSDKPFIECLKSKNLSDNHFNLIKHIKRKIGITGANGFIGIHLLTELLQYEDDITILGRGNIIEKIKTSISYYKLPEINFDKIKIENVELLHPETCKRYDFDVLFNCAADTTLGDSIEVALDKSKKIANSISIIGKHSKIVHISTLSLIVSGPKNKKIKTPSYELGPWTGCYAQAKALSETILAQHPNTVIIRPALVTGGTHGIIPEHDLFKIAMEACMETKTMPIGKRKLSAMDVETTAKAIRILSFVKPGIYPLASKTKTSMKDLSQMTGFPMINNWQCKNGLGKLAFEKAKNQNDKYNTYDLFLATKWKLNCKKTDAILKNNGLIIPSSNKVIINTIEKLLTKHSK